MQRLSHEGACFTIDVLGEEISSMDEAQFFLEEYMRVMEAIKTHQLDANLSIKPTAFGLLIDREQGMANIRQLVQMAASEDMFVRLDMEDHRVTTDTIDVVVALHAEGLTNVGTVLQGRLFRTLSDIDALQTTLGPGADYRICKGIYLEPEEISFTGYRDIVDATNAAVDRMLDAGAYVGVASHDQPVIDRAFRPEVARDGSWNRGPEKQREKRQTPQGSGIRISSCSWASVARFAVACSKKAIGRGSTSRTVRSGTNTASVGCKRTPPLAHKWPRRSCSLGQTVSHFLFFFFERPRLAFGFTPFLTCSLGRSGVGIVTQSALLPRLSSLTGCPGCKMLAFGRLVKVHSFDVRSLYGPRIVRPAPVWMARMRHVSPLCSMRWEPVNVVSWGTTRTSAVESSPR